MFCDKCGANVPDDGRFCPECGNSLDGVKDEKISESDTSIDNGTPVEEKTGVMKGFSWIVLAVFILQGSFLFYSIALLISKGPISPFWSPAASIVTYAGLIFFLRLYTRSKTGYGKSFFSGFGTVLFLWGIMSLHSLVTGNLYRMVVSAGMDNRAQGFIMLAGYVALIFVLQLFILAGLFLLYASMKYGTSFFQTDRTLKTVIAAIIKKIPRVFLLDVIVTAMMIVLFLCQYYGGAVIEAMQQYGFMKVFMKYLLSSVLYAGILSFIFLQAEGILKAKEDEFRAIAADSSKRIPFMPIACAGLAVVSLFVFSAFPQNGIGLVMTEIEGHNVRGDILRDTGYMTGAAEEYDMALSKLYSLKGYLLSRKAVVTKNNALSQEANQLLKSARDLYPLNGYILLFEGNILMEEDRPDAALDKYRDSINNPLSRPEVFTGILKASVKSGNREMKKTAVDWLLANEVYSDSLSILSRAPVRKIDKWLSRTDDLIEEIEPKMAYKHYEKTKYNEHEQAARDLLKLAEKYPDNVEINYLLTRIFAEYRKEQSNYNNLIQYTNAFVDAYGDDQDSEIVLEKESYAARMHMLANDFATAESIMADLYHDYPENRDTAETYLYILVRNKKLDDALQLAQKLEKEERSLSLTYYHALCLLNMGKHEESLDIMEGIYDYEQPYSEEYDRYLYAYSLAYANAIKNQEHIDMVDAMPDDGILKYYILGMKGWKDKNSEAANVQLDKVVEMDDRLGYALYCKAINEYEKQVRNKANDFDKAINYYLRSIQIVPEHVEAYFALAHCYKKADMKEEALRAFRRVLLLLPYEDHRVDPYGMTVHAEGEVKELANELKKGGR